MLSKNFISLLESMKSPHNEMYEDRDERVERREERRRERREDKFGVSTSSTDGTTTEVEGDTDFKIRPFIRAVDQLKSQVQSEIFNIDQTIKNRESGHQSASTYKTKFNAILEIILKINSKIELIKDKEGRNLEAGTATDPADSAEIKIFRGLYTTASNDFLAAQKEWSEKKSEADTKYLSDLKDTDTNNFIISANTAFDEAKAMLNDLIRNSQLAVNDKKGGEGTKDELVKGVPGLTDGAIIKGGKYAKNSREGKVVIAVKQAIYSRFRKYESLSKSKDWGIVYKSGVDNVSGTLLANTQNVIKLVKLGLSKDYPELSSDKTGDITPAFVNAISKVKVQESISNNTGRLISFQNFIKNKMNEDFDEEAVKNAISSGGSYSNSGGNKSGNKDKPKVATPEYSATPFKNDTEGNTFRAWVIKNHADWAKTNNLDATGAKDNTYVRKAYQEFGADYKKSTEVPAVVKKDVLTNAEMDTIKKKIESYGAKAQLQFTVADKQPCILFWSGKQYAFFYNTRKVTYKTSAGKSFSGIYDSKTNNVTFAKDKAWDLKYVAKFTISDRLAGEKAEVAQKKDVYVAKSGEGYVNVRSNTSTSESANNIIIKFTDKSKPIGFVLSTTVVDSPKLGKKTWYKVQFPSPIQPNKNGSNRYEYGWVRSDTVDLK